MNDLDGKVLLINNFIEKFKLNFTGNFNEEIKDWELIKKLISFFMENDEGSPAVDFIDATNWDLVESFSFNDAERSIEMVWHDFDSKDDEIDICVFGAHKLTCEINIDSIVIVTNRGIPILLVKGFYQSEKEINKRYNSKCSGFALSQSHPFSQVIRKVVKKQIHDITLPNINLFTTSLVPNCAKFINSYETKNIIYNYNHKLILNKIISLISELGNVDANDQDKLKEKGNTLRRYFENALKILNLKADTQFNNNNDYQKLMLGDLVAILGNLDSFTTLVEMKLEDLTTLLNGCSHDSGVNVDKDKLMKAILLIISAITINYRDY